MIVRVFVAVLFASMGLWSNAEGQFPRDNAGVVNISGLQEDLQTSNQIRKAVKDTNGAETDTNEVQETEELSDDEFIDEAETVEFGDASLVVGLSEPFRFSMQDDLYNDEAYMMMIGSPRSNLTLHYGESVLGSESESMVFRVNGQIGGNAYLWRRFLRLPLSIYVPIHFNIGYQHLGLDIAEADQTAYGEFHDENMLNFSLGAGAGATFELPLGAVPLIGEQITLDAMFIRSPGMMIRFVEEEPSFPGQSTDHEPSAGVAITNDLLIQGRVHRFLESSIGVTAGFKFSRIDWDDETRDFGAILNMITGDEVPEHIIGYSSLYVGINW